jgi:ACS family hexuronate transporter-like MFS transporter
MAQAQTTVSTAAASATPGVTTWRMWVPCLGMALCSWLSFVDRGVLGVLSPTILADTGMTAQDYGNVVFYFFLAYTFANPLWGSLLDRLGLRVGMLLAVALWTAASASHALMSGFIGFAFARALLGIGEGATFPGGLRTAVESLPANQRARGIATSWSGGTIGAIVTPLMMVPIAVNYGWRAAFVATGIFGAAWLVLWAVIARPPYLPASERRSSKLEWPNPLEIRFWALVLSYALPALAPGPILNLMPIYLTRSLGVAQAELAGIFWIPPAAWGLGYFVGGWAADKYAADNQRPIGMFLLFTACAIVFGITPALDTVPAAIMLMSWACFIGGAFQMLAMKVGSYAFPREQAAMMSGIASGAWSLANAGVSPIIGRFFDQQRWDAAFWLIALAPLVGVVGWIILSQPRLAHNRRIPVALTGFVTGGLVGYLLRPWFPDAASLPLLLAVVAGLVAVGMEAVRGQQRSKVKGQR